MKRIILFSTLFLFLSVICFPSCKKEQISPTQGEVIAKELKDYINKNAVKRVYPVRINYPFPNMFPASNGTVWSFSNGFIYIDYSSFAAAYNLNYLVDFNIANVILDNGKSEAALILYMETL